MRRVYRKLTANLIGWEPLAEQGLGPERESRSCSDSQQSARSGRGQLVAPGSYLTAVCGGDALPYDQAQYPGPAARRIEVVSARSRVSTPLHSGRSDRSHP